MRKEVIGDCTLYLGDCRDVLPLLPAGSVDAVITSPPYAQQRKYGFASGFDWDSTMDVFLKMECATPTCQVLVNLGLVHKDGECITYWEPWRERMRASGWRFFGWYVWDQGDGLPGDWNGRFAPSHEFIFHFNTTKRNPSKIVPTKSRGRKISGTGLRLKDGTTNSKQSHDGRPIQAMKISDSVVRVYREMNRSINHPAKFPVGLPSHLIRSYTNAGETILDPFLGSGTTGEACVNLGRQFIGCEINPEYFDTACKRIEKAYEQKMLPV